MSVLSEKVIFLNRVHGTLTYVAKRTLPENKDFVRYRKCTYLIDRSNPTYSYKGKIFYFYVIDDGQVSLNSNPVPIPLETIDDLFTSEVIRQCVSKLDLTSSTMGPFLYLLIGAALGAFAGFGIAGMI